MIYRSSIFPVLFCVLLVGCGKDDAPTPPEDTVNDKELLALGWKDFEEKRYDSAITNFTDAYNKSTTAAIRAESLCGRGWANSSKRDFTKAKSDFAFALGVSGIPTDVDLDVRTGHAFVAHAQNDFTSAISFAHAVLTQRPAYVFVHDTRVTAKRVRMVLIQSYYADGQFAQAAGQMDLLDPAKAPHATDPVILLQNIIAARNSL
ncbi:MAG: hypothetical protein WEE20_13235 [Bacteroidota bacterium]